MGKILHLSISLLQGYENGENREAKWEAWPCSTCGYNEAGSTCMQVGIVWIWKISNCEHDKFGPAVSGSKSNSNKAQINMSSDCRVWI